MDNGGCQLAPPGGVAREHGGRESLGLPAEICPRVFMLHWKGKRAPSVGRPGLDPRRVPDQHVFLTAGIGFLFFGLLVLLSLLLPAVFVRFFCFVIVGCYCDRERDREREREGRGGRKVRTCYGTDYVVRMKLQLIKCLAKSVWLWKPPSISSNGSTPVFLRACFVTLILSILRRSPKWLTPRTETVSVYLGPFHKKDWKTPAYIIEL